MKTIAKQKSSDATDVGPGGKIPLKVALGEFTRSVIEARIGVDVEAGMQVALRHYVRRLKSRSAPVQLPKFAKGQARQGDGGTIELEVDPEIMSVLEAEAEHQGVKIEELAVHAVLVYLADLDSSGGSPSESSR